jgi:hypothetical protein
VLSGQTRAQPNAGLRPISFMRSHSAWGAN